MRKHIWYRSSLSAPSESDGGWLFLDAIGEVKAQKQKKTPETAEKDARLLELPEQGSGSDKRSMRERGFGGMPAPLGFAHAFGGGSNGFGHRLILNLHPAPTEQNGAGAEAAQLVVP